MKNKIIKNGNDYQLCEKILTLCIQHEIKNSNLDLNIIMNQIKLCEIELERLKDDKPLFFQKKKIEEYNKHIEIINDKISNYYIELNKELDILCKLEQAI